MNLDNRVCIVTGAGMGIGEAIATVLAERGAKVVIADRDAEHGPKVAAALSGQGRVARFIPCDVSVPDEVAAMVRTTLDTLGGIDVLVNNAGVYLEMPFEQSTVEDFDRQIGVNLRGVYLCTRACLPHLLQRGGGSVVNIASVHATACCPGAAFYDAAKHGVVGMTKALAVEFGDRNIRFNTVSPGLIHTAILDDQLSKTPHREVMMNHWHANIPVRRAGAPREIANVVAFLASDEASYVTGSDVIADGGMTSQLISRNQGY